MRKAKLPEPIAVDANGKIVLSASLCVACGRRLRMEYGFCHYGLGAHLLCGSDACPMQHHIVLFVSD